MRHLNQSISCLSQFWMKTSKWVLSIMWRSCYTSSGCIACHSKHLSRLRENELVGGWNLASYGLGGDFFKFVRSKYDLNIKGAGKVFALLRGDTSYRQATWQELIAREIPNLCSYTQLSARKFLVPMFHGPFLWSCCHPSRLLCVASTAYSSRFILQCGITVNTARKICTSASNVAHTFHQGRRHVPITIPTDS